MRTGTAIAAMLLAATGLMACKSEGSQGGTAGISASGAKKQGQVLASVGNDTITVEEYLAKVEEQPPFIRQRYNTVERKKELLQNMIRSELLAQEAMRRGFLDDPEVQATLKKIVVQKLMRAEFEGGEGAEQIPEAKLKAFYDENLNEYVKPERVRASHVFFAAAKGDANRAKVKAEAQKVLAQVRKDESAGPGTGVFASVARERSDDQNTRSAGGDLLFRTHEELAANWGADFAQAAFSLQNIGELGALVETDKGIHVLKLTGRQNALERSFEQVKGQIQNRLVREQRTQSFEAFVAGLEAKAGVSVKEDILAQIPVGAVAAEPLDPDVPVMKVGASPAGPAGKTLVPGGEAIPAPATNVVPNLKPAGARAPGASTPEAAGAR